MRAWGVGHVVELAQKSAAAPMHRHCNTFLSCNTNLQSRTRTRTLTQTSRARWDTRTQPRAEHSRTKNTQGNDDTNGKQQREESEQSPWQGQRHRRAVHAKCQSPRRGCRAPPPGPRSPARCPTRRHASCSRSGGVVRQRTALRDTCLSRGRNRGAPAPSSHGRLRRGSRANAHARARRTSRSTDASERQPRVKMAGRWEGQRRSPLPRSRLAESCGRAEPDTKPRRLPGLTLLCRSCRVRRWLCP